MPELNHTTGLYAALQDFWRLRRQAGIERVMAQLTGKSVELLAYEDVVQKLRITGRAGGQLQDIPLAAIVGSVGRYTDFSRSFLPLQNEDQARWARVKMAVSDLAGLPPIEVYRIGEAYFVLDGNHRVSVARELGATYIQAYVTEVRTRVSLSPDDQPDDLIIKAEYAAFLEQTNLDELRPEANLLVTIPGRYRAFTEHIEVHHYFMGLDFQRSFTYPEAVAHWYDEVYLPVVQVIREQGLLREFPGRTEADLYLWLAEHRAALQQQLSLAVETNAAAADLAAQFSPRPNRVVARLGGKIEQILDTLTPDELDSGPLPGQWRRKRQGVHRADCLFADILAPVSGEENGWRALESALVVARRENSQLFGLHVVSAPTDAAQTQQNGEAARAVQARFEARCADAGVPGKLAIVTGEVSRTICERSRWVDLIVANLAFPPQAGPLARLGSGFRTLIRRCPRPLLAVTGADSALSHPLLAYDGSPKAQEALYVATYIAGAWGVPLTVLTVTESGRATAATLARGQAYLTTHGVQAECLAETGPVAETLLQIAAARGIDLIIMGGYGYTPVLEVVLGSTVDHVLRAGLCPVLMCR
ncbi:MAG: hypothetical protein AUK03_16860 [Anaerolineae bacterium CG2_30_64_16]|nr:MAG: hypothetical protein AUK03_16860 [Anaerolineae bacterium CG2_30_64_16]